jgi:hypothetical protein
VLLTIIIERRLEDERLQIEAKKREREEQHLFLTAKVRDGLMSCTYPPAHVSLGHH